MNFLDHVHLYICTCMVVNMWLMFLHFPNVVKPAAVTEFTAVTAPMCHESVTLSRSPCHAPCHKRAWQCDHLPTLYDTAARPFIAIPKGISHSIFSPHQPLLHSLLTITQPLQVQSWQRFRWLLSVSTSWLVTPNQCCHNLFKQFE